MESEVILLHGFSVEDFSVLSHQHFDSILNNPENYSREEILGHVCEFMDRVGR